MGNVFIRGAEFIIATCFDLYILCVMLRLLLQLTRADFYNPLCQFLIKVTNPLIIPMRRVIPGFAGLDTSSVVLLLFLAIAKFLCLYFLIYQISPNLLGLLLIAITDLCERLINVFFFAIIIQVILSWVSPGVYNPVTVILNHLTNPLLSPARKWIPPIAGLDLSPLVVLLLLQLCDILLIQSLNQIAFMAAGVVR